MFNLPDNYICNNEPEYYYDPPEPPVVHQPDVYPYADRRCVGRYETLVDVGCGSGSKLRSIMRPDISYFGYDYGSNLEEARSRDRHKQVTWREINLEDPFRAEALPEMELPCIIVACDVIEHLRNPQRFLMWLRQWRSSTFIFSTPDRARIYPPSHNGPPANPAHVREWAEREFCALLWDHGFTVIGLAHTRSNDTDCSGALNTLLVHAR